MIIFGFCPIYAFPHQTSQACWFLQIGQSSREHFLGILLILIQHKSSTLLEDSQIWRVPGILDDFAGLEIGGEIGPLAGMRMRRNWAWVPPHGARVWSTSTALVYLMTEHSGIAKA
jgi:hypothetical protein